MPAERRPTLRTDDRHPLEARVLLKLFGSQSRFTGVLSDLSVEGCRVTTPQPLQTGTQLLVRLPGVGFWQGAVAWRRDDTAGIEFQRRLHPATVEQFALRHSPAG
ncbi:MAG TPA: PilZ domain-containing protein [Croceibacterium sp.]|nr:PilZ domain-containing protein [Croceibacterium sp.]